MLQALLGYHKEARWIRHARMNLTHLFPYIPKQPGYHKRLRTRGTQITHLIRVLALDTDLWQHPVRIADSTPVECGRSRETVNRPDLAGWATYGYCASHSRRFWGLRLHLVTTVHGLPVAFALATAKTDEREALMDLFDLDTGLLTHPDGLILVVDKGYRDAATERQQGIESVNQTLKGQLDLERHGGRTATGVLVRVAQRILAMTAAIWHNWTTGQPVMRSLIAYDH